MHISGYFVASSRGLFFLFVLDTADPTGDLIKILGTQFIPASTAIEGNELVCHKSKLHTFWQHNDDDTSKELTKTSEYGVRV